MTTILHIAELSYSIQSSGINIGKPMVFCRLSGCNLHCRNCHVWSNKGSEFEILEIINNISLLKSKHLLICGGEPLIQKYQLLELFKQLDKEYFIELECNGTLNPNPIEDYVDLWIVSPKLLSSGNPKSHRERPVILRKFTLMDNVYFKFEIENMKDLYEFSRLMKKYKFDRNKVILVAKNPNMNENLIGVCKARDYRFQIDLNTILKCR